MCSAVKALCNTFQANFQIPQNLILMRGTNFGKIYSDEDNKCTSNDGVLVEKKKTHPDSSLKFRL